MDLNSPPLANSEFAVFSELETIESACPMNDFVSVVSYCNERDFIVDFWVVNNMQCSVVVCCPVFLVEIHNALLVSRSRERYCNESYKLIVTCIDLTVGRARSSK